MLISRIDWRKARTDQSYWLIGLVPCADLAVATPISALIPSAGAASGRSMGRSASSLRW
ncbi:MAG: hypothetical protein R2856_26395 [Caldilineaceae bacterium]